MDAIARLMVMIHHSLWLSVALSAVCIIVLLLGFRIKSPWTRTAVLGLAVVASAFVMTTGVVIAPLDDWQHQHGGCLLDNLQKEPKK